jgi:hypothetical protein
MHHQRQTIGVKSNTPMKYIPIAFILLLFSCTTNTTEKDLLGHWKLSNAVKSDGQEWTKHPPLSSLSEAQAYHTYYDGIDKISIDLKENHTTENNLSYSNFGKKGWSLKQDTLSIFITETPQNDFLLPDTIMEIRGLIHDVNSSTLTLSVENKYTLTFSKL